MKMNNKLKKDNGITLIALVVTIVVLIILAGVSISLVLGNNGIISKARQAKEETLNAQVEEQEKLNQVVDYSENMGVTTPTGGGETGGTREDWSIVENGDGTGTISYFKGTIPEDGVLVIPNKVDGVTITKLEMSAEDVRTLGGTNGAGSLPIICNLQNFSSTSMYNSTIKKIIVSEGITTIGNCAFYSTSVETIELPTSITKIGREAFASCSRLKNIRIYESITEIGERAFYGCTNMEHVYFDALSLPTLGLECFYKNSGTVTTYHFKDSYMGRYFTACGYCNGVFANFSIEESTSSSSSSY